MLRIAVLSGVIALTGCATGTDGPVPIGGGAYMIGGLGGGFDYSASTVKAKFFKEASEFCEGKGQEMIPINSTGKDAGLGTYASAEVQFRCAPKSKQ